MTLHPILLNFLIFEEISFLSVYISVQPYWRIPTVATDGEEGLLVVVGGDVKHEHVGPAHRGREHASVSVQA